MIPKAEGTFSPFPVVVETLTSRSRDEENEENVDDSEDYCVTSAIYLAEKIGALLDKGEQKIQINCSLRQEDP